MKGAAKGEIIKTADLYQMVTYISATKLTSGLLIYAEDTPAVTADLTQPRCYEPITTNGSLGLKIHRIGINLATSPVDTLAQIENIALRIRETLERSLDAMLPLSATQ